MTNPNPKQNTAVTFIDKDSGRIHFDATLEAFEDIRQFGSTISLGGIRYGMDVSGIYDFDEVLAYIKGWQPADLSVFENALPTPPVDTANNSPQ